MTRDPEIGDIVWTCQASSESKSCYDLDPREPYRVKVESITKHRFVTGNRYYDDPPGGPRIDDDHNAEAYGRSDDFYATESEAWDGYIRDLKTLKDRLEGELKQVADEHNRAWGVRLEMVTRKP
jgi:hypothetical protein